MDEDAEQKDNVKDSVSVLLLNAQDVGSREDGFLPVQVLSSLRSVPRDERKLENVFYDDKYLIHTHTHKIHLHLLDCLHTYKC